jgi:hypothetical protein
MGTFGCGNIYGNPGERLFDGFPGRGQAGGPGGRYCGISLCGQRYAGYHQILPPRAITQHCWLTNEPGDISKPSPPPPSPSHLVPHLVPRVPGAARLLLPFAQVVAVPGRLQQANVSQGAVWD